MDEISAVPAPDEPAAASLGRGGPPPRLTRAALCRLAEGGDLSGDAWRVSFEYLGLRPDAAAWGDFWRRMLLLCGALFLASGVIFFIAWNWADMHRFARLGLMQAVVAGTALLALWRGPDSLEGRVSLLACALCVGPMLAVFGQTYQSGAELWELFRVWGLVIAALALVGRQAGLWLTAWVVGNLAVMMYLGRSFRDPGEMLLWFGFLPEYLLAQFLALAAWEGAARLWGSRPQHAWLRVRWLPRLFAFALSANLTWLLCLRIVDSYHAYPGNFLYLPQEPTYWLLYGLCLAGAWLWHRRRNPDLFMPACGVASLACLLVALLIRARFFFTLDAFSFFAWGMVLVGLTWAVGKTLIFLQRAMEREAEGRADGLSGDVSSFFSPAREKGWAELWAHLRFLGLVPEDTAPPASSPASPPWYVQALLAGGGWVAALLFIVFLGLFLYMSLGYRDSFEGPLLVESVIVLAFAGFCMRRAHFFARRFGFAAALAGAGGAAAALCMLSESARHWALFAAIPLALTLPLMRSASYRFVAALFLAVLLPVWFGSVLSEWGRGEGTRNLWLYLGFCSAWWATFAGCMAQAWLREEFWRAKGEGRSELIAPVLCGAYAGLLIFLIIAFSGRVDSSFARYLFLSPGPAGLGAGAGFTWLVWRLTEGSGNRPLRMALTAPAALLLPLGWYLPGVGAAVFGLGLARYLSSPVMLGATGFFLFAYMVYYYYYLGLSLLHKSLTLAVVGLVLLAAGFGIKVLTGRIAAAKPAPASGAAVSENSRA